MLSRSIIRLFALVALFCFVVAKPAPSVESANEMLARPESSVDENIVQRSSQNTVKCNNKGNVRQARLEFGHSCDPRFSKGIMSTRECVALGGKTYLCVHGTSVTCHHAEVETLNLKGGECFS